MTADQIEHLRVLVVDDYAETAAVLAKLLRRLGCETAHCAQPAACVELAKRFQPHLIFLDIAMPIVDGFAIAQQLPRNELPPFRLVAMSGYGDQGTKDRCAAAGFDDFRLKPLLRDDLGTLIESARRLRDSISTRLGP